jgi:hypothetical protein
MSMKIYGFFRSQLSGRCITPFEIPSEMVYPHNFGHKAYRSLTLHILLRSPCRGALQTIESTRTQMRNPTCPKADVFGQK